MAITSSSVFNRYRVSAGSTPDGKRVVKRITVHQGTTRVDKLQPINRNYLEGWNPGDSEFEEIQTRVEEGRASAEYEDRHGTVHQAANLPGHMQWMREADPIAQEIDLASAATEDDFGPVSLIVYMASVDKPTDDPPDYTGSWPTWSAAIEDEGFAVFQRPATTGEEKVWEIRASYGRSEGTDFTEYDDWDTDTTLYSTDNGETFTTDRPANNQSGTSSITHIRRYNVSLGEWEDTPFSPQFQGRSTATDALGQRSFGELTRGNRFIEASIYLPRYYTVRGLQNGRTVKVGVEMRYREAWGGPILLTGYTEIPDDRIPLVAPHEIEDDAAAVPVPGKTFLFVLDNVGRMNWGLIRSADRLNNYYGDYHRFTALFRSNATGRLHAGIGATADVLQVDVKPRGIAEGTIIYLTGSDGHTESVRVTTTPSFTPTVGGDGEEHWTIAVARGGRDGARAWAENARWYADFEGAQKHAQFVVFAKAQLHAASEISIFQVLDQ